MISNSPRILAKPWLRRARRQGGLVWAVVYLPSLLIISLANALTRLFSRLVRRLAGGHREGTHHPLAWAIGSSLLVFLCRAEHWPLILACALCGGALLHLACDACTYSGIPAPIPWRRARFWLLPAPLRLRTDGAVEHLLLTLFVLATAVLWGTLLAPDVRAALFALADGVAHSVLLPDFLRHSASLIRAPER